MTKKLISYNVNGIRAAKRKGFDEWLEESKADVVLIQETKAQPEQIEEEAFKELGYHSYWHSAEKKGYSGVGILSKEKPQHVEIGCGIDYIDQEGRIIRADFEDYSIMSVYIPSGSSGDSRQDLKVTFLNDFRNYILALLKEKPNLIIGGDFNICHTEIDIHNPKNNKNTSGFLAEEREWVSSFLEIGMNDSYRIIHPGLLDKYSWWSYRANARANNKGWRIDYQMVSDSLKARISGADILKDAMHSDHCPVVVELD
ncbi:MAG: exodeoxyribonuclease-3 [Roseivirga sp.]|jgi:exodeoxyribonuclease-3